MFELSDMILQLLNFVISAFCLNISYSGYVLSYGTDTGTERSAVTAVVSYYNYILLSPVYGLASVLLVASVVLKPKGIYFKEDLRKLTKNWKSLRKREGMKGSK